MYLLNMRFFDNAKVLTIMCDKNVELCQFWKVTATTDQYYSIIYCSCSSNFSHNQI